MGVAGRYLSPSYNTDIIGQNYKATNEERSYATLWDGLQPRRTVTEPPFSSPSMDHST